LGLGGEGVFLGVLLCAPGEGGPGDLPLSNPDKSYRHPGLRVVIVMMSNGYGNVGWHGRGDVMPSVDVSQVSGNNANLEFIPDEKVKKMPQKSPEVVQGMEGNQICY
jgi:hypothetical protein